MANGKTIHLVFGLFAGLLAYAIVGKLGLYLLQISWADYATHSQDKSYTLGMLLARLVVGLVASITASVTATKMATDKGKSAWLVGTIVFLVSSYIHLLTITWTGYPVWYHFAYLVAILPVIGLSHAYFANR